MTDEQRQRIDGLFGDLYGRAAEEQHAVLSLVEDEEVRTEVESLLEHAGDVAGQPGAVPRIADAVGRVMVEAAASGIFAARAIGPGTRFDHYRIVRRIGQGGMGEVYEAARDDDFHKRVALKLVRYGLDSEFANRRFQQERQMLAGLEHPNIARLLDGGETEGGCPYLVLEFVEGTSIDVYCSDKPRQSILRIFLKVCEAVEYAHRNLVIHRDLKPANILVTATGEPKLLDFGIAKLLDAGGDATQTGLAALTPQYASPEQVKGETITTASDVYSLGMVLYELLSGSRPYTLSSANIAEVHRVVCQMNPARPGVSEDLDNILLMALRKDPARRYRSVRELAEDIERSLTHRPVLARKDSLGYRTKKFVRRHWTGVAAGFALFFAITAGVGATVYQTRVARQRFEQVRKLAHNFVFDYSDELAKLNGTTELREKMVRTALEYLDNLSASAGNDVSFQKELAAAYQKVGDAQGYPTRPSLGHTDQAIASYRKAAQIHERIAAIEPLHRKEAGAFYVDFAELLRLTGNYAEATKIGESARRDLEQIAREQPSDESAQRDLAEAWCLLGDVAEDTFHNRASLEEYRQCDTIARRLLSQSWTLDSLKLAQHARERVGTSALATGHLPEALAAFDEDQQLLDAILTLEPETPVLRRNYAILAQFRSGVYYDDESPNLNDPGRCLKYSQQYLDAVRQMVDSDPNNTSARLSLAIALFRLSIPLKFSDPAAAVAAARESVAMFDAQLAAGKQSYLVVSRRVRAVRRLSEALLSAGHLQEARDNAVVALAGMRDSAARDPHDMQAATLLVMTLLTSAEVAEALHDRGSALGFLSEADRLSFAIYSENPSELTSLIPRAQVLRHMAGHWKQTGDEAQAQQYSNQLRGLWQQFPERNDFVRREVTALTQPRSSPRSALELASQSAPKNPALLPK